MRLLLEVGANKRHVNNAGETAYDAAGRTQPDTTEAIRALLDAEE